MEKQPDPPRRRSWWNIGAIAVLLALLWTVAAIHYFSATRPRLEPEITDVVGGAPKGNVADTYVMIAINVPNSGAVQTVLKDWTFQATADGVTYDGSLQDLPKNVQFEDKDAKPGDSPDQTYTDTDITDDAANPIEVGDMAAGTAYVRFPYINTNGAVDFTVNFKDVFGGEYSITNTVPGKALQYVLDVIDSSPKKSSGDDKPPPPKMYSAPRGGPPPL